jgi:hypothetical protein
MRTALLIISGLAAEYRRDPWAYITKLAAEGGAPAVPDLRTRTRQ